MIVASMTAQYGIRMYGDDFRNMKWVEFRALISGLGPDTPLGRIVSIRSENNPDILKGFTKEQRKIRNEWRKRMAKNVSENELFNALETLKNAFSSPLHQVGIM